MTKTLRWVVFLTVAATLLNTALLASSYFQIAQLRSTIQELRTSLEELRKETEETKTEEELRDKPRFVPLSTTLANHR